MTHRFEGLRDEELAALAERLAVVCDGGSGVRWSRDTDLQDRVD